MQYLDTIHEIAQRCGRPESEVEIIYDRELSRLRQVARVMDYLPVLARRTVLDNLRRSPQTHRE